jgi:fibronectin type 3 domain-containing protein
LDLANAHVYYALTSVDLRYNESQPSKTVFAAKPNRITPDEPVFTGYEIEGSKVKMGWLANTQQTDLRYALIRQSSGQEKGEVIFSGDHTRNIYTDEPEESGTYTYWVVAEAANGKQSKSPQPLTLDISVEETFNSVAGFSSYTDREHKYIELSWRRHEKAKKYRIYKAQEDAPMSLWKETEAATNRMTDEYVSPDTKYAYTILFVSQEGRVSKSKTIVVHY